MYGAKYQLSKEKYYSDEPLTGEGNDILRRSNFIDALYKSLKDISSIKAFVYGISGKWGDGKSSVVSLLKKKVKENKDNELVFITFNPWYFSTNEAILNGFYDAIEDAISKDYIVGRLKRSLNSIKDALTINLNFPLLSLNSNVPRKSVTLEEIQAQIKITIQKYRKKYIVIIDDLDRINKEELVFVLKLIKLSEELPNLVFLLLFDEGIIEERLANLGFDYFDKFIQIPLKLPQIDTEDILAFLNAQLNKIFSDLQIDDERVEKFHKGENYNFESFDIHYQHNLYGIFKNLRIVKRYLNVLIFDLQQNGVKDLVDIFDFCLLELIKLEALPLYYDIFEKPWYYVKPQSNIGLILSSPFGMEQDDYQITQTNSHIYEILEKCVNDERKRECIRNILFTLFPYLSSITNIPYKQDKHDTNAEQDLKNNKIRHPQNFQHYFIGNTRPSEIPITIIDGIIDNLNQNNFDNEKLEYIFSSYINSNKITTLIDQIMKVSDRLNAGGIEFLINFIFSNFEIFIRNDIPQGIITELLSILLVTTTLTNEQKVELLNKGINNKNAFPFIMNFYITALYNNLDYSDMGTPVRVAIETHLKLLISENEDIIEYPNFDWYLGSITYWFRTLNPTDINVKDYLTKLLLKRENLLKFAEWAIKLNDDQMAYMEREYSSIIDLQAIKDKAKAESQSSETSSTMQIFSERI